MSAEQDKGSERLPLLEPQELTREQREVYDRIECDMLPWAQQSGFKAVKEDGKLLGPFNVMLYNPELGAAQLNYLGTERNSTELDASVREVVILTVGAAFQCAYELYAHRAVAARNGLQPAEIEALAQGIEAAGLKPNELAAHRFVRTLAIHHRVDAVVFDEAKQAFGLKGLVDMLHLAGMYMSLATMLNAFEIPVPQESSAA